MPEPDFLAFERRLLQQGVDLRYARRLGLELAEHYEDLRHEAERTGILPGEVAGFAAERLGSASNIAAAVRQRPELRPWVYRYPQLARLALPLAFAALLPVAPLFAGINHAESVLRWICCAMLSAIFTAVLLLGMQLSIALA
jgi:Zn-dependent protease